MPGGTQLHLLQHVPQALWHKFGRDDNLHLATHAPLQSENYNIIFILISNNFIHSTHKLIKSMHKLLNLYKYNCML